MLKSIGLEVKEEDRWQFLQDNADSVESIGYTHRYTPEELAQKKELLAEVSISLNDIENEKKEAMKDFKNRMEPLKEQKDLLLGNIKSGAEYVPSEECAKFVFEEENMVGYYNQNGELVYSRPIMPQEMQKNIFRMNRKTGTDN